MESEFENVNRETCARSKQFVEDAFWCSKDSKMVCRDEKCLFWTREE